MTVIDAIARIAAQRSSWLADRRAPALSPVASRRFGLRRRAAGPDPRNTFSGGACSDFAKYMKETGVYDGKGANHPGWAGATTFVPNIRGFTYPLNVTRRNMWECPCKPGVYYETQQACDSTAPCKSGLGGCLIKCGGALVDCLTVTKKMPYVRRVQIDALAWKPPSSITDGCRTAIADFDETVRKHEQRHKEDANKIFAKRRALPPEKFTACGKTTKEAESLVNQQIATFIAKAQADMEAEYLRSVEDFHATEAGKPALMDCRLCDGDGPP
jgi:hypothetical protein